MYPLHWTCLVGSIDLTDSDCPAGSLDSSGSIGSFAQAGSSDLFGSVDLFGFDLTDSSGSSGSSESSDPFDSSGSSDPSGSGCDSGSDFDPSVPSEVGPESGSSAPFGFGSSGSFEISAVDEIVFSGNFDHWTTNCRA